MLSVVDIGAQLEDDRHPFSPRGTAASLSLLPGLQHLHLGNEEDEGALDFDLRHVPLVPPGGFIDLLQEMAVALLVEFGE